MEPATKSFGTMSASNRKSWYKLDFSRKGRRNLSVGWRLLGALLFCLGLGGFFVFEGVWKTLLSCLIVPGLLVAIFPPPYTGRKLEIVGLVLAIVGAVGVPVALFGTQTTLPGSQDETCRAQPTPGTPISLTYKQFRTDDSAQFVHEGDGWKIIFPNLKWAGLYALIPDGVCRYRIDFEAEVDPLPGAAEGAGWGYASGVCNSLGPSYPIGVSLQYAFLQESGRPVAALLRVILPDANTYVSNATSNMEAVNYGWNHWTIVVDKNIAKYYFENDTLVDITDISGSDKLPRNCDNSGIFLRTWGGTAHFRKISAVAN